MLFNIDKHLSSSIAAIDCQTFATYGDICNFCNYMSKYISNRSLIFNICSNSIGGLLGYLAFYHNRSVQLLISNNIDRLLLKNLIDKYQPNFIWSDNSIDFADIKLYHITKKYDYILYGTHYDDTLLYDDLSLLLSTSGSTGSGKLVRHKYGNIEYNAEKVAKIYNWSTDDVGICDLPLYYTMGLNVINSHLYSGSKILLWSGSIMNNKFFDFIKKFKGTSFTGVPYSYEILDKLNFYNMNINSINTLSSGGGRLHDNLFKKIATFAKNNKIRFFSTFGTTETSARMSYLSPNLALQKIGSIGKAIPNGRLYLVDENDSLIEGKGSGELVFEGDNVTMGYAETKNDLKLPDIFKGKYKTGDIAERDDEGFYYIIGRKKRFAKLYGIRISLEELERLISDKFNTESVCSDDKKNIKIYLTSTSYSKQIPIFLSNLLHIPLSSFHVQIIDSFPRTSNGKIEYKKLQ